MPYILFAQLHPLDVRVLVVVTAMPRDDANVLDAFSLSGIATSEREARATLRELIQEARDKVLRLGGTVEDIRET